MQVKNLIGLRYGRLVVIERAENDKFGKSRWLCRCDCGNVKIANFNNLRAKTKSCGCLKKELLHATKTIHGDTESRLYHIWCLMKARCTNENRIEYVNYGGRGINVCSEWSNYSVFKKWALSSGYANDLSIDRIDNDGNYEPGNCRWATKEVQANNTRTNHFLTFKNQTLTISEWSKKINASQDVISSRIKRGWTVERALLTPLRGALQNA